MTTTSVSIPSEPGTRPRLRGFALASVMIALMLTLLLEALDQAIVGTAMPVIRENVETTDAHKGPPTASAPLPSLLCDDARSVRT